MKLKYLLYMLPLALGFTACSEENSLLGEEVNGNEKATVNIHLQQDLQINADTRSTIPMSLENANKIYNLYLLHYNAEGTLITADTQYKTLDSEGVLETSWNARLTPGKGTICLIANLGTNGTSRTWPAFLADLKKTELLPLPIDGTGLFSNKMYMFGYYEGTITNGMGLNVLMGRMAACVNIVLTANNIGYYDEYNISTTIKNAVTNTHYFPTEEDSDKNGLTYSDFSDQKAGTIGYGQKSLTLYYYMGENIAPEEDERTTITIKASNRYSEEKTYTVILGSDAPGTTNRNFSIYRNNNYTFNINLN